MTQQEMEAIWAAHIRHEFYWDQATVLRQTGLAKE
jgi:hypothetical protein